MTPQEVLSAAKQDNPQAIAALMNRSLKPKGITAKAKLTDGCLHVMLEGVTVPNQGAIVPYITDGIKGLEISAVRSLVVYGRVTGEDLPAWSDRVELVETVLVPVKRSPAVVTPSSKLSLSKSSAIIARIGLAAVLLIAVIIFGAVIQMTASLKKTQDQLDGISQRRPTLGIGSQAITMSKYDQLETGMTYTQTQEILGKSGEEQSKNELAGMTTVMYAWKDSDGSNMNAIFQDDKLVQKAQFGLK